MSTNFFHPNLKLLSNSSMDLLNGCPRKYELYKMIPRDSIIFEDDEESIDLTFGTTLGIGIQSVLVEESEELNYIRMLLSWRQDLDKGEEGFDKKKNKTFFHALIAVDKFRSFKSMEMGDLELVSFKGKPAIELGFSIDCGDGFFYRGKLDALLFSKRDNTFTVLECKSTGANFVHEAMYKNQGQGIGYSIIVDAIASSIGNLNAEAYNIKYVVYKTKTMEWETFNFTKSHTERALWIKDILLAEKRISDYVEEEYFPRNGNYCYAYFRVCKYFDTCGFSNKFMIPNPEKVPVLVDKAEDYTFKFTLEDLITAQLEKQK